MLCKSKHPTRADYKKLVDLWEYVTQKGNLCR